MRALRWSPHCEPQQAKIDLPVPRRIRLSWKAKVLLLALSVLTSLLALECAVRVFLGPKAEWVTRPFEPLFVSGDFFGALPMAELAKTREGPRASGYRPTTGLYLHDRPIGQWDPNWRANFLFDHYLSRYSAKDADRLTADPSKPIRIFVVGGSLAVGSSATAKETTWHAQLEAGLRKHFQRQDIHVINAAMGAFVSSQERVAFEFAVAPRDPDMVIILNGYNDIHTPISVGVAPGDPLQTGMRYSELYDTSFTRWLCGQSALARLIWKARAQSRILEYQKAMLADTKASAQLNQGISEVYCGNMEWLVKRCDQMKCPTLVFLQPWRDLESNDSGPSQTPLAQFARETAQTIRNRLQSSKIKDNFIDLAYLQGSLADRYTDEVHVDDQGQTILADSMLLPVAKRLEERVRQAMVEKEMQGKKETKTP